MFDNLKISRLGALAAGAMMLCAASSANAVPFSFSHPGPFPSPIDVPTPGSTVTINVADTSVINDLNVGITLGGAFTGPVTFWDTIDMSIQHNSTTVVLNIATASFAFGLFDVTFDDSGADLSAIVAGDAVGSFAPEGGLLSDFNGQTLAGDWNLTLVNNFFPFNSTLVAYSISGDATPPAVPEPGTLALFGLGLAGLGYIRRRKVA